MSHILKAFIFCLCVAVISCTDTENDALTSKLHKAANNTVREKRQIGMGLGLNGMGAGLGGIGALGGLGGLGGIGGIGGLGAGIGGIGGLGAGIGGLGAGIGGIGGLQGATALNAAGFGGLGRPTFDFADYYANFLADAAYDYYDWVCTGASCQLCDVLTGDCCDPNYDRNCFMPDSCANNPCLSGGTCISTLTVDFRPDFMCVCQAGLTGKYCQLIDEYSAPLPAAVPAAAVAPAAPAVAPAAAAPAPIAPAAQTTYQTVQTIAKPQTATVQVIQTYPQTKTYQIQQQPATYTQTQAQPVQYQAVQQQSSYAAAAPVAQAQPVQYQSVQSQPTQYQAVQSQPQVQYQVQSSQPTYGQTFSTQTLSATSQAAAPTNQVFKQDGTYVGTMSTDSIKSLSAKKFNGFTCNCPNNGYCAQVIDQDGNEEQEFFCICKDEKRVGSAYGSDCLSSSAHKNPCVQNNEVTSADRSIPKSYFIECKGGLPFLRKCHGESIWNNVIKHCVDFTLHKKRLSAGMSMQGTN